MSQKNKSGKPSSRGHKSLELKKRPDLAPSRDGMDWSKWNTRETGETFDDEILTENHEQQHGGNKRAHV